MGNISEANDHKRLINQALQFHSKGNISKAVKYYQHLIKQGVYDHRIYLSGVTKVSSRSRQAVTEQLLTQ